MARVVTLIALGVFLWRGADVIWGENIGCIVEGEAYRSAQLGPAGIDRVARKLGVRSVINLRGENDAEWYRDEVDRCGRLGIAHYDVALSARRLPDPESLARLIEIFGEAPTPLLIHCKNGADRTGLAAAIYLEIRAGLDDDRAEDAGLSVWRGHLGVGATGCMDQLLELRRANQPGMEFARWAREVYPALYLRATDRHAGTIHG